MFSFRDPILLGCIGTQSLVAELRIESRDRCVFGTIIGSQGFYSGLKQVLHLDFELMKNLCKFTFRMKKIDPSKMGKVINKKNIVAEAIV